VIFPQWPVLSYKLDASKCGVWKRNPKFIFMSWLRTDPSTPQNRTQLLEEKDFV
jgi:hypothetical protein